MENRGAVSSPSSLYYIRYVAKPFLQPNHYDEGNCVESPPTTPQKTTVIPRSKPSTSTWQQGNRVQFISNNSYSTGRQSTVRNSASTQVERKAPCSPNDSLQQKPKKQP
ncbi:hypothetical protein OUZ56_009475 [Daphnia magna]|uniref:Uncharacterized protein n=1 Tax=Daphnia magna TaxID=35525 RepID=A0ABR0AGC3_9CRUS|nr:hypothetical protein OUZ56_009475 [Daphnia magna]